MQDSALNNYFRGLAESHYLIKHNKPTDHDPQLNRKAFFGMEEYENIPQDSFSQIDYPCLRIRPARGRFQKEAGTVNDVQQVYIEIVERVPDRTNASAVEAARDRCKAIAVDLMGYIDRESEDNGNCGPLQDFDLNSVQYDQLGPINLDEFGYLVFFQTSDEAFNPYTKDYSTTFL